MPKLPPPSLAPHFISLTPPLRDLTGPSWALIATGFDSPISRVEFIAPLQNGHPAEGRAFWERLRDQTVWLLREIETWKTGSIGPDFPIKWLSTTVQTSAGPAYVNASVFSDAELPWYTGSRRFAMADFLAALDFSRGRILHDVSEFPSDMRATVELPIRQPILS